MQKIKLIWLLSCLSIVLSCKSEDTSATKKTDTKPNIIVIYTDDQGYGDIGYHGNPWIKTPHLDHFAKESLELTNFHVGTTCAPSRAGLLTGRNANRNNAWHTIGGCSILTADEVTIADVLAKNGYETSMVGKWHLGDNYPFRPQDRGFKQAVYHGGGGVQQTPDLWNNDYFDDTYFRNGVPEKFDGYCTDVWFNEAISLIEKSKDKPFYMHLAPNAAHGPYNVPAEYAQMYKDTPISDKQKRFYGMITNIDDNFGKLVSYLKKEKLFDNTILIFSTDNGSAGAWGKLNGKTVGYNAGLKGKKGSHYDGGHRVPFFMSWPNGNILKKQAVNELTAHVDMLPTLIDLAGIEHKPNKPLDGTSVAKILSGEDKEIDRMLVIDTQRNQLPIKGKNSCVMSTKWRLIDGKELYNTINDPGQKNNIAKNHPEIVKKMQSFYDTWWTTVEPDVKYAHIPLGYNNNEPVLITVHDIHTENPIPWNQDLIRIGKALPQGFYSVKVEKDGEYQFELSRYAPDSKLAINSEAKAIAATPYVSGLAKGLAFNPKKAKITIGENTFETTVNPNNHSVILKGKLTKGKFNLQSEFITADGNNIPAYYTNITLIN
ncbi:arylsulfatase [Postechiella marina]|uniref:Arylsulfatase n=1 Tax=Postechiella marina TaxID=943941 RepID=A0ABP8CEI2_9FLAO